MKKGFIGVVALGLGIVLLVGAYFVVKDNETVGDSLLVGAPSTRLTYQATLLPLSDSLYDLGTTSSAWRNLYTDEICLAGDCQTAWSAGGGEANLGANLGTGLPIFDTKSGVTLRFNTIAAGSNITLSTTTNDNTIVIASTASDSGSGNVSTSTGETSGQLAYWTSTNATPALLGKVATTSLTASSPLSLSQAISVIGASASALSIDTSGTWSGNAGTASALAANGTNCSAGSFPLGVDEDGAVESCTDAWTEAENTSAAYVAGTRTLTVAGTANQISSSAGAQDLSANRTWTLSLPSIVNFPNTFFSGTGTSTLFASASTTIGRATIGALTATSSITLTGASGCATFTAGVLSGSGVACGAGGGGAGGWTFGEGFIYNATTTDQVLIGATATTTTSKLEVAGNVSILGSAGTSTFSGGLEALTIGSRYFVATSSIASQFPYASSTALTVSGSTYLSGITSALMLTGTDGLIAEYAGTSCTNQFVRSLSVLGVATCATVGSADVDLADLTATNGTLTFSGTYDGQTARTIGLNLGNANTWTALQTFGNSTTSLASFDYASSTLYYGAGLSNCNTGNMLTWTDGRFGCEDDTEGTGAFAWTPTTNFGAPANATTSPIWFQNGLQASTTSHFVYASSTALTAVTGFFTNLFIGAIDIAEYIADTAGAMFTGNTETGVTVTYQDADNTIDVVCNTADTSTFGCLTDTDWDTFNGKQDALGFTAANSATTLTIAGTASQILSSAGAQDLSANRTWTLSFPSNITFPNSIFSTSATSTLFQSASSTIGNLTVGTFIATSTEEKIFSITVASTSPAFIGSATIPISSYFGNVRVVNRFECFVSGGTSKAFNLSDAISGNDTESLTCDADGAADSSVDTNDTFNANETMFLEMGATVGTVDYVTISVYGLIRR